jgi:hypothetical protein
MKNGKANHPRRRTCGFLWWPVLLTALLAGALLSQASQMTTCQETAIPIGLLDPGVASFPDGNTHIRGMTIVQAELAADPRVEGRATVVMDLQIKANGDVTIQGVVFKEVGTWDLNDPSNPQFTPSGGVWVGIVEAKGNMTGNLTSTGVLHGIAGEVEGLQYKVEGGGPTSGISSYTIRVLDPQAKK